MDKSTYHIIVIGCQMNKSDAERMASYLDDLGYKQVYKREEADLVILFTCGIRQSAEDRIYGLIPRIKKENKKVKILLTGCLSERKDVIKRMEKQVDYWFPIIDLPKLSGILGIDSNCKYSNDYLKINPKYSSSISAFVPIGNGCDNFCTYCVVPYARGREVYRKFRDILDEVKDLIQKGYKEITLIAQNVNSYRAGEKDFSDLLVAVNNIPGKFWLRFATSHPKDMSDKLIKIIGECEKICEHVHLPAQAGNNKVLAEMNRNYTIEHYKTLIDKIYKIIPDMAISTDIIVGFPGETEIEFNDTVRLFEYVKYDMAYIARFSVRPGTQAEKFEDNVSQEEKKKREGIIMEILKRTALVNSEKFLGKTIEVLVEGINKNQELYGRTRTSKNVKIKSSDKSLIGQFVKVKIDYVEDFGIGGYLILDLFLK